MCEFLGSTNTLINSQTIGRLSSKTPEFQNNGLKNLLTQLKKIDPVTYKKIDLSNHRRIIRALEVSISSKKPYSSFLTNSVKASNLSLIHI